MAASISAITISQQIYYQLVQLTLVKNAAPKLIDVSLQQPEENKLAISLRSRNTPMYSPLEAASFEDTAPQHVPSLAIEDTIQPPAFSFVNVTQTDQVLQAYAQAAVPEKTTNSIISIFI